MLINLPLYISEIFQMELVLLFAGKYALKATPVYSSFYESADNGF